MDPVELGGGVDPARVATALSRSLELTTDLVVVIDLTGTVVWSNEWGLRFLELERDESIGRSFLEFLHPDDLARATDVLARSFDPDQAASIRPAGYRIRRSDGTYHELWFNGAHVADQELIVIHGRRVADLEVQDAVIRAVAAGASVGDALGLLPRVGRWWVEDGLHAVFHRDDEGRPTMTGDDELAILGSLDDPDAPVALLAGVDPRSSRAAADWPEPLRQALDALGVVHLAAETLVDPLHGSPCVVVTAMRDDADPAVLVYLLDRMVPATQLVLGARDRIIRLRALADELRQFLADASHELRTPLTSIIGYTDLYASGALDPAAELDDAMYRIRLESRRLLSLVEDLLLLARLGERRPMVTEPVEIVGVVRAVQADAAAADRSRTVSVVADGHDDLVVAADEDRIRQVLTNLVTNARVHTPSGTPIEITVDADGSEARVAVVDHGPGLDPEAAELAFRRFWRGGPSPAEEDGGDHAGAGLGLPIAKGLVDALGGRLTLDSVPGGGASFVVHLPRERRAPVDE